MNKKIIIPIFLIIVLTSFATASIINYSTDGIVTIDGDYTVVTCKTDCSFNTTETSITVSTLIIGGGGGGGKITQGSAGGGGAGGLIYMNNNYSVNTGNYSITVGAGGVYATPTSGADSVFNTLTAIGGGAGGYYNGLNCSAGGSGGGVGHGGFTGCNGVSGQGNFGGSSSGALRYGGGGGGGAGALGDNTSGTSESEGGDGGVGRQININGTLTYYAGGGGGASHPVASGGQSSGGLGGGGKGNYRGVTIGTDGTANTGGGGGGSQDSREASPAGGDGGSGIVILRFLTEDNIAFSKVKITNNWNNSVISGVNVTLSSGLSNLTGSNGIALFNNISGNFDFNATINDYITITGTTSENNTVTYNMSQSQINLTVTELFSGNPISNFSINISGVIVLNTSGSSGLIFPNIGNYTGSVIDNTGEDDFHTSNTTFEVFALDNKTHIFRIHQHFINVNVTDIVNGSTVQNFTINIFSLNTSDNRTLSTNNGSMLIPVIHNDYNVTIINAVGYAYLDGEGNFNYSELTSISSNETINFSLFRTNSINFTFFNEETPTILLSGINISLDLLNGGTQNLTTNTGYKFVQDLTNTNYEARYNADGYDPRSFFFTVIEGSTQNIALYLSNSTNTEPWAIRVADENDNEQINVTVRLQQQFIEFDGQFITVEECKTNSDGRCPMFINEQADIIYRFIVLIDDEIVLTTIPSPIFVLVGGVRLMTLRVTLGSSFLEPDAQQLALFSSMTYNNNTETVNYTWIDGNNAITRGCLTISRRNIPSTIYTEISEDCFSGFSGTLIKNVSTFLTNNTELKIIGSVDFTNNRQVLQSIYITTNAEGVGDKLSFIGQDELLLTAFGFLLIAGSTILIPSLLIQAIVDFGFLTLLTLLGMNKLGTGVTIGFMILALFIGWSNRENRGRD